MMVEQSLTLALVLVALFVRMLQQSEDSAARASERPGAPGRAEEPGATAQTSAGVG